MANLSLLNLPSIVANSAAAVQGSCKKLLNLSVGSVLRSILEAFASVAVWLQYVIVQVWMGERLSTSTGEDIDTFIQDFQMFRLPAVPATGTATFSRFSSGLASSIVPYFLADGTVNTNGTQVSTADGTQIFGVTTDTSNPAWNSLSSSYSLPIGSSSIDLPVKAITAGIASNVQANAIALIDTAIPGVDTVTNAAPFLNGEDAESDNAVRSRFANYINTRARATLAAVEYAISSVQSGLTYTIAENADPSGAYRPGNFVITLDDGTGAPSASLISAVYAAVDAVRPIGSTFSVLSPTITTVTVSLTISVAAGASKAAIAQKVQTAILNYIDAMPIGSVLHWSVLANLAWSADPGITNVSQIALDGTTSDVDPGIRGVIKAGTISIN